MKETLFVVDDLELDETDDPRWLRDAIASMLAAAQARLRAECEMDEWDRRAGR